MSVTDQFIEWNPREVIYQFINSDVDGGILTFESSHPKWSYAKIDNDGLVSEDIKAGKNPISTNATVGVYYWKEGKDYVKYAEQMIKKLTLGSIMSSMFVLYITKPLKMEKKLKLIQLKKCGD